MKNTLKGTLAAVGLAVGMVTTAALAAGPAIDMPRQSWPDQGIFGSYDRASLQRGLQVYKEVCSACHAMDFVAYRNLMDLGYSEDEVKAYAAEFEVEDGPDEDGEMFFRPARPSDTFINPFPNQQAARAANNGAYPPDLSLITKARAGGQDPIHGASGADYLYNLLVGYRDEAPEGFELGDGMYYNDYYSGHQIAMAPPLWEDGVEFADGTAATVDQMARDVTHFLSWAAEPKLEQRKETGRAVILFLIVLVIVSYIAKRRIWADAH